MKNPQYSSLPPGFRFHPTDEELILHYLKKKITSTPFPISIIADVDIYKFDPWDLPAKSDFGEKEWYFFSQRDRKYPNGARPNRAAASGYWKATGTDKLIVSSSIMPQAARGGKENIGVKKALVFYKGRPPKGVKTNWIMHEYRLADAPGYNNHSNKSIAKPKDSSMRLDDWVLCRIYKKSRVANLASSAAVTIYRDQEPEEEEEQLLQETLLPSLTDPINSKPVLSQKSSSFSNLLDAFDFSVVSSFLSDSQLDPTGYDSSQTLLNGRLLDQPFLDNANTSSSKSNSNSSSYLFQKHPNYQLNYTAPLMPNIENKLKRHLPSIDHKELLHPSKKHINSRSFFINNTTQLDMDGQYNFLD